MVSEHYAVGWAAPANPPRPPAAASGEERAELARLRRRIAELELEKGAAKATVFFARETDR